MPRPTINDVATLAGVSKKTVSFVLNERGGVTPATRARVEAAIATLGFRPNAQARSLSCGEDASLVLAFAPGERARLADAVRGALRALGDSGLALIVTEAASGLAVILRERVPRGIVSLGEVAAPVGTVKIGPQEQSAGVSTQARQAAADAAHYLLTLGHRRIALAAGPEDEVLTQEHERGLAEAMAQAPLLVANGDGSVASGKEAADALLDLSPAPSAILAANAEIALGVLRTAQARDIAVPGGLSVIALEDSALAEWSHPPLSAMRHDWVEIVESATRLVLSGDESKAIDCRATLIARGSVAAV